MSLISKILPADNILCDLDAGSKERLFEAAAQLFENKLQLPRKKVFDNLAAREKLGSTGLGHGIAIPHGRIKGLREATGAFIKLKTAIPFDAPDSQPVSLLFILLVPEQATEQHLQILSELAQMFSDRDLREQLTQTQDAGGLHQLISSWQPDVTNQHSAAV